MPIYAYRCEACGFAKDALQKVSDPQLTVCPSCGAASFKKQLTAAGFQLKGTGWYATDFRNGSGAKTPAAGAADTAAKPADDTASVAAKSESGTNKSNSTETAASGGASTAPAAVTPATTKSAASDSGSKPSTT